MLRTDNRTLRLRTSHGRTRVCVVTQRTARLHADITHAHKALVHHLNLLKNDAWRLIAGCSAR